MVFLSNLFRNYKKELAHRNQQLADLQTLKDAIEETNTSLAREVHLLNKRNTRLTRACEALLKEIDKSHFFNPELTKVKKELENIIKD